MKIGQEFKVQQDKEIESLFGDETLKIKKGDKQFNSKIEFIIFLEKLLVFLSITIIMINHMMLKVFQKD